MSRYDGGPAFPRLDHILVGSADGTGTMPVSEGGMSLRDYFAGQALVGMMAGAISVDVERSAQRAYEYADAMLKAREQ